MGQADSGSQRSSGGGGGSNNASTGAPWADLPRPLWEQITSPLPTKDVMALRQACHATSGLAGSRVRAEAAATIKEDLDGIILVCRGAAVSTVMYCQGEYAGEPWADPDGGYPGLDGLTGFMQGAMSAVISPNGFRQISMRQLLGGGRDGYRCTYSHEVHKL